MDYAWNRAVILVAAAGNDASSTPSYTAACNNVIAVASTDRNDARSSFSNYGSHISVAAPGSVIYSTMPTYATNSGYPQNYDYLSGTSMATPHVAGLAALILSQDPSRTNAQVRSLMESSADDKGTPGWDQYFGYGRINAYRALSATPTPTSTPPGTNLLLNPSFESWSGGFPSSWQVDRFGLGRGDVSQSTDAQSGSYSYQVTGDGTGIEQTVNLTVGRTYTLSF